MNTEKLNMRRRQIFAAITGALGAIFSGLAAIPVFGSMNESARTKNEGAVPVPPINSSKLILLEFFDGFLAVVQAGLSFFSPASGTK